MSQAAVYVVRVQEPEGHDEDAYQFNQAEDAFDKLEELQANGCAAHVVRRRIELG
jgi:hypothetical protein